MLELVPQQCLVEHTRQRGWTQFKRAFYGFAVDGLIAGRPHIAGNRSQALGVGGVLQSQLGAKVPAMELQRKRDVRAQIESAHLGCGTEEIRWPRGRGGYRLVAGQTLDCAIERPIERRVTQSAVKAGKFKAGSVSDGDHIVRQEILEILKASDESV